MMPTYYQGSYAGCYYHNTIDGSKRHLPLVKSSFHTTIYSDRQQTAIKQTFTNSTQKHIDSCKYSFPIYEGVSVTGFTCEVAGRKLVGIVKEKAEAKAEYDAAVSQGKKAGLLEQSDTSDVFNTSLGNVEINQDVDVTITYIGELKNDLDSDNIRLTIPTHIAPRYGDLPEGLRDSQNVNDQGMNISIDVIMPEENPILGLESPSHPISVSLGKLSTDPSDHTPSFSKASAMLSDSSSGLQKDFVFLIKAKQTGNPTAVLQTHPTLKNYRSLMVSLVPKFSLPSIRPEIVFVADRSGSMQGNIWMLQQALNVFLKSIPAGVKFNVCSFGSRHSFLWPKSQSYTKNSLNTAIDHVKTFDANYGGTNTLDALQATIRNRYADIPLEIILLTDGDIWAQEAAFDAINKAVVESKHQIRLFPLGIGDGVSHSLIEGLARAGNGFAQAVQLNERIDTRVVRMLKAALTPHVNNYSLEIKYDTDDDFELIEAVNDCLKIDIPGDSEGKPSDPTKPAISLFDTSADPDAMDMDKKDPILSAIKMPKLLQAPHDIPSLYSFSRTTVYILMSPDTIQRNPVSVVLKGESEHGLLRLEIPVTTFDIPGEAISQLAARKAVQDFEEHRGWIYHATNSEGKKLVDLYPSRASDLVKQEAVRLGTTYGIANKWCSFIAVDADSGIPPVSSEAPPPEPDYQQFTGFGGMAVQPLSSVSRRSGSALPPPPPASRGGSARNFSSRSRSSMDTSLQSPQPSGKEWKKMSLQSSQAAVMPFARAAAAPSPMMLSTSPQLQHPAYVKPLESASSLDFFHPIPSAVQSHSSSPRIPTSARAADVTATTNDSSSSSSSSQIRAQFSTSGILPRRQLASKPQQQAQQQAQQAQQAQSQGQAQQAQSQGQAQLQHSFPTYSPYTAAQPHPFSAYSGSAVAQPQFQPQSLPQSLPQCQSQSLLPQSLPLFITPTTTTTTTAIPTIPTTPAEKVHTLIALQDFDGFWNPSATLIQLLGITDEQARRFSGGAEGEEEAIRMTALVIAFLRTKMASEKEVWELVVDKAVEWLGSVLGTDEELIKEAEACF